MQRTRLVTFLVMTEALVGLVVPARLMSQEQLTKHHRYRVIDLGTFGGPGSFLNDEGDAVNKPGVAVGGSETGIPDLPDSNPFPCAWFYLSRVSRRGRNGAGLGYSRG